MRLSALVTLFLALCSPSSDAQENCGFPISVVRTGFENGEQPNLVVLPSDLTPLSLSITSPTEGEVIPLDQVQVYGSLTGPANTGVSLSTGDIRQIAWTNATQFTSRPLPLVPGANSIAVTAKTMDGVTVTAIRSIVATPSVSADVRLQAVTTGAYSPRILVFKLQTSLPPFQTRVARVQVDYQGDGTFEVDATSIPTTLSWNYDFPGAFIALARVTFDDTDPMTPVVGREARYRVQIQSLAYARQTLCSVYYTMKSRLQGNQPTLALNTLGDRARPKFQTLWTSLGPMLPTVASNLGQIATGQISDVSAELIMALPDTANPGAFLGYPVLFTRGQDGVWRIYAM
jgi:hypothetical protein